MKDVLELPFDQYQRYALVTELVNELRRGKERLSILDVGGRTALLRSFLPKDAITLVDLEPSDERPLVLGDGSRLPFAERSFDLVLAFDTLEHVPVPRRTAFVSECARVARRHVVLAGPYQSPEVEEAERLLQQFLKDKLGVEHRYLEEHRHHGLPDRTAVERQFERLGASVKSFGHGNLDRWLALICLSMYMDYRPELRGIAARFQRFYNARMYVSDHTPPVYRHAIVAAVAGAELPRLERLAQPASAPPGAARRIEELAFELGAFERAQGTLIEEKARLAQGLAELRADLAGHQKSLTDAEARKAEQRAVIATLEADLDAHKASLSDLERDVATQVARFDEAERGHALVKAAFETDLAEHKTLVAALERELGEHKGVLEEVRRLAAGFERELETLRALRERELQEASQMKRELEARLAEHAAAAAVLEADLREHKAALAGERSARAEEAAGLRAVIADVEQDRDERGRVIAELRTDLARHAGAVRELEAEVRARGAALTRRENGLDQHRAALAATRGDLDAHKSVLAAREKELDEHRAVVRALEDDLAGHRRVVLELRAREEELTHERNVTAQGLEGARAEIDRAREALAAQHATIEALRAELGSRWRTFKRALGPRRPTP
ncbi:MAG: methyltransferase domain-containing protein [Planctomycetes bacterium]|nr:methyltransferase domain-containing protein [Planctomycetota bacterium]